MSQDYTERDLHLFCRGDIRTDGWESEWKKDFRRRMAEEAAKPRPIVTAVHIQARRIRSKTGEARSFSGPPCTLCGKRMRDDAKAPIHERCGRIRPKCVCGKTLILGWPHPVCGTCYRAAEREKALAGKRICAEPGCGKILQANNSYPKCREHSLKLRNARNAQRNREKLKALREAA